MSPLISTFLVHPKSIICTMEETNKSIDCSAYWESTKLSLFQSLKKMRIFLQRHIWFQVLYHMKLYISLHKVVKTWYIGFLSMSSHWAFAITNSLLLFHITSCNEWRGDELIPRSKNYISFSWDMPWISLQDICRTQKKPSRQLNSEKFNFVIQRWIFLAVVYIERSEGFLNG